MLRKALLLKYKTNMTRYPHLPYRVRPDGVLEKVIEDFAPVLLDDPASLSAIRHFVFAPTCTTASITNLMDRLHREHGVLMAPELIEGFVNCLQGARKFVHVHQIQDLPSLESHMQEHNQRMAQRIKGLLHPQ